MARYHHVDELGGNTSLPAQELPGVNNGFGLDELDTGGWRAAQADSGQPPRPRPGSRRGGPPGARGGRRSGLRHPSGRALGGIAAVTAMVLVVSVSLLAYAKYRGVLGSIHQEKVTAAMLGKRPPFTAGLNILVIGSDSRAGTGHKFGTNVLGSRSDTSMVLHIAPGHARADIISFPRDSMVPILSCSNDGQGHAGQQVVPGQLERLNATFSAGGAPCLWKTLEQETGIRIQHFVEVNFAGFQSIVNDVGGVPVCLPFAINNQQANLHLGSGRHLVNGAQALAFVRLRENIGEGSDTQRIQRQQYFLAAVMQKLKATNLLSQPTRIFSVVRDAAKSLTTDTGLDLSTMLRIADSMKSLNSKSVEFITVPVVPYAADPAAELSWEQPQADNLFRAIEADRALPRPVRGRKGKAAAAVAVPTVSPSQVQVQVLNGSGVTGIAGSTATALTGRGFKVTGTGAAANYNYTSNVIQYATAAQLPEVNTLKAELGSVSVQQDKTLGSGPVNLILGSSFTGLRTAAQAKKAPSLGSLAKNYGGITASTNICSDSAAFAGPDTPLPGG